MQLNTAGQVELKLKTPWRDGTTHLVMDPLELLKRVFDIDMQHCPYCGTGELEIIAAILERPVIEKILTHLGLEPQPPPRGRACEAGQEFAG